MDLVFLFNIDGEVLHIAALDLCCGFIDSNLSHGIDFQFFTAVLIASLDHESILVRKSALNVLESINDCYISTNKVKDMKLFGQVQFFDKIQRITSKIAMKFTNLLIAHKDEIIMDSAFVPQVIKNIIGNNLGNDSSWESSTLNFLCSFILHSSTYFKTKLIAALSLVDSANKMKLLFSCFQLNSLDVESSLNCILLKGFFPDICSSLFRGKHKRYFKIILGFFNDNSDSSAQVVIIEAISQSWFDNLDDVQKAELMLAILYRSVGNPLVSASSNSLLLRLSFSGSVLSRVYEKLGEYLIELESSSSKKHKSDSNDFRIHSLVVILEIQENLNIKDANLLVAPMFGLLGTLSTFQKTISSVSIEYLKQLVQSSITSILETTPCSSSSIRTDYAISTLRTSDNPQTHSASLLLLSQIAKIEPDSVLINIMPVFTFMGSVLRQDDNYSFWVIKKTLESVLPSLLGNNTSTKDVLKIFVDAVLHIPIHRRLPIFSILIRVLGENSLWKLASLLVVKASKSDDPIISQKLISFISDIICEFDAKRILDSCESLVLAFLNLGTSDSFYGIDEFTTSEIVQLKSAHLMALNQVLEVKSFLDRVSIANQDYVESKYADILRLIFIIQSSEPNRTDLLEFLDKMHSLLSPDSFIKSISSLLQNNDMIIVHRSILLLNRRLSEDIFKDNSINIVSVFPDLINNVANLESKEIRKSTFDCLSLISSMSKKKFDSLMPILDLCTRFLNAESESMILISILKCLGSLVEVLGTRSISHLSLFMNSIIRILENPQDETSLQCLSTLAIIVNALSKFLSPFVSKLLLCLDSSDSTSTSQIRISELKISIQNSLIQKINCRIILPCIYNQYSNSLLNDSVSLLFKNLVTVINAMSASELLENYSTIFSFYLIGFDSTKTNKTESLKTSLIDSFLLFVGKLNDVMFRSLFLKLVDWGSTSGSLEFMYALIEALLDKLGSLFSSYCGYVLENILELLRDEELHVDLWKLILRVLSKYLINETQTISIEKASPISEVLVKQLQNVKNDYEIALATEFIVPCFGQLCLDQADDFWKGLSQRLLMITRNENSAVRIVSLRSIAELYRVIGADMLSMVAETLPFVAELNEDDDSNVEKESRILCKVIEGYLGEDLEMYMS